MSSDTSSLPLIHTALLDGLESETAQAYLLLGGLRELTKWDEQTLVKQLGCHRATKRSAAATMKHSVDFLGWVVALCNFVDREVDRRDIVFGAVQLSSAIGGPLEDRVKACTDATNAVVDGELSARELLKLGEIPKAWRQAALAVEAGPLRESAERVHALTKPLEEVVGSHINPRRLRWLLEETPEREAMRTEKLGATVALEMDLHLENCTKCAQVAAELGLHPGPSATRAHAA